MKITRAHVAFYQAKRAPVPGWGRAFPIPDGGGIHYLINLAAGIKPRYSNRDLCPLLLLVRRNMATGAESRTMLQYLRHLESDSWTRHNTPRRAAWAAKWANRLEAEQRASLTAPDGARKLRTA